MGGDIGRHDTQGKDIEFGCSVYVVSHELSLQSPSSYNDYIFSCKNELW